ncbi:MAG: LamG domain-containing protein, partial [Planctomycetota bacterium]
KTTVLAFSSEVLAASLSAARSGKSALAAGPLRKPLRRMPSDTSKMALINIGGAIRVADAYITAVHDNPLNPAHNTLAQLARAYDKTCVQLRTGESVDNFNLRISVEQLPPLDSVLPLLKQLAWVNLSAKAKATKPRPLDGAVFGLTPELKLRWKQGVNAKSHKVYFGTEADELLLLAEVKTPSDVKSPPLRESVTYYWRVDEVWQDGTVISGDVWSFSIGKLVGWWKLDETSGETAYDSSGNGNVGTLQGDPVWQPLGGKVGGALEFDGIDDYVDCGSDASLDITNEITIAAWVKTNDSGNSQFNPYVTKGDRTYGLKHHSRNTMEFVIYDGYWRTTHFPVDSSFNGVWHHLAGTYDGSQLKLYIDGTLEVTTAHKGSIASNTANLDIARNSEEAGRFYDGAIDDVRIYNYALSPDEIETIYRVKAVKPRPVDGAVVGPATKVELSWAPGIEAASHKVFFGSEADELALLAEVTSPAYAELPALEKDAQYYWRIDEVRANGTVVSGDIWSFTTSGRLIGWWKLDEASGGTAEDSSGSDHSGTLHGDPGWQPTGGKVGGALKLDGDGDYVKISDESDFDLTGQITVAAWIKARAFDKERQAIVTKGGSAWRLHRNLKTDNIRFNITYGYEPSAVGKVNVNDGQWHHIVGAYDGAKVCLYVDGELDGSKKTSKSIMTNNEPVCIGENSEQTGRYWNGLIDDVRIYNYALSHDEVAAFYQGK